jgi:regulatory protein
MRQISLRQRALEALSRREYSRVELRRRLAAHTEDESVLDQLLDTLEHEKLLSNQRFAESLSHRRSEKYGLRRLEGEWAQHGLDENIIAEQTARLKETEVERCEAVWNKKFGVAPEDMQQRARQQRFLASRGFDAETIGTVLRRARNSGNDKV